MSALPIYLSDGMVSVYETPSAWGLFNPNQNNTTRFGTIDQTNYDSAFLVTGSIVMYDERDVVLPIFYNGNMYSVLSGSRVIATEYVYNIEVLP